MVERSQHAADAAAPLERSGGPYSWYVLSVLVLVYAFNFIDRQILSILNEDIKADLGLTDAYMGFLYGTAFAPESGAHPRAGRASGRRPHRISNPLYPLRAVSENIRSYAGTPSVKTRKRPCSPPRL